MLLFQLFIHSYFIWVCLWLNTNSDTACGPCLALERKYPNRQHDSYWIYLFFLWSTAEFDTQREKRREQKEMACLILTGKLISNP